MARTSHRRRLLLYGGNALLTTIAAIGIAIVGYILVDRYRPFRVDMTRSGMYELSPRTREVLSGLQRDVKVTFFEVPSSEYEGAGFVNSRVSELLEEYRVRAGGRLTWEVVNPLRDPLRMQELAGDDGAAVFTAGEDRVTVQRKEIFEAQFGNFEAEPQINFTGEEAFTSALLRLAEGATNTVCFLTGHGEFSSAERGSGDGYDRAADALRKANFQKRDIELTDAGSGAGSPVVDLKTAPAASLAVPPDCTVLVIAGPSKGVLSDPEIDAIARFWESGRGVVFFAEPLKSTRSEALAARFGLELLPGVVYEPARKVRSQLIVVPEWAPHEITDAMDIQGIGAVLPTVAALKVAANADPTIKATPLLRSSEDAVVVVDIKDGKADPESPKNIRGPVDYGYALEKSMGDAKAARAVVLGDADFATTAAVEQLGGAGNEALFENAVTWAAGTREKLAIGPKDAGLQTLSGLTDFSALLISGATVFLIPAMFMSVGALVWVRRRKR